MPHEWKVGELAKITGLTIRTLRYYDQIGLFSPSGRTEAGYRLYTESDLGRLQQILSLKELGLSLEQIKSVLAENAISLYEIVTMQMDRLRESIRNQQRLLFELERAAAHLRDSKSPSVESFTRIMQMMRLNHERYFDERQAVWNAHLDRLGAYLKERFERT
jgi:Predicted transcriptional regulators